MASRRGPISIHDSRPVYENPWIDLTEHDVSVDSGRSFRYTTVHFKRVATGVVPLHDDGSVTLVGQHRFPLDSYSWEIPEGGADPGEAARDAASRELGEEAGLAASRWQEILVMHLSNSVTDEIAHVFLATDLSATPINPEDTEELAIRRVPFTEAMSMCVAGAITDAITVAAIFRVFHLAATGGLPGELNQILAPNR